MELNVFKNAIKNLIGLPGSIRPIWCAAEVFTSGADAGVAA